MTNAEEMVLKTVHDLGVAGDWDVCNYTGLSPVEAGWALNSLYRKECLKIVSTECECDTNEHGEAINVGVFTLFELTPEGKEAAQGIPDINEPMCIPITNIQLEKTKWISVDDELPEIPEGWTESPEPVLYMMKNTKTIYAGYYGEGGVWRDKYFRQYEDSRNGVDADDVTCWMYQCDLPKPPKGE